MQIFLLVAVLVVGVFVQPILSQQNEEIGARLMQQVDPASGTNRPTRAPDQCSLKYTRFQPCNLDPLCIWKGTVCVLNTNNEDKTIKTSSPTLRRNTKSPTFRNSQGGVNSKTKFPTFAPTPRPSSASPTAPSLPPTRPTKRPTPKRTPCANGGCVESPTCHNGCFMFAFDGECDDGGVGSVSFLCPRGSDCADCGDRKNTRLLVEEESLLFESLKTSMNANWMFVFIVLMSVALLVTIYFSVAFYVGRKKNIHAVPLLHHQHEKVASPFLTPQQRKSHNHKAFRKRSSSEKDHGFLLSPSSVTKKEAEEEV